ncbi:Mov34/MPN/PAD-1 family protein [Escherichia coli]|uniref:Mov34/MPN/PAD-1 family protein n=1 Tax=Escherichia coli TaxID=562 RepID=UPI003B27C21D
MTETESAILAHARRCAPAESCGFVVRTPEGERYFPCVNISGEPEDYSGWLRRTGCRQKCRVRCVALVHSHPGGLPWLSEADRRLQCRVICRGGWFAGGRFTSSAVCHIFPGGALSTG